MTAIVFTLNTFYANISFFFFLFSFSRKNILGKWTIMKRFKLKFYSSFFLRGFALYSIEFLCPRIRSHKSLNACSQNQRGELLFTVNVIGQTLQRSLSTLVRTIEALVRLSSRIPMHKWAEKPKEVTILVKYCSWKWELVIVIAYFCLYLNGFIGKPTHFV